MCQYCDDGRPCGGGIENLSTACENQLAESLRDAIRSIMKDEATEADGNEIDRYINEFVSRIQKNK